MHGLADGVNFAAHFGLTFSAFPEATSQLQRNGFTATLSFPVPIPRQLCIDNRDGPETTVAVGELQWKVEANQTPQISLTEPANDVPVVWGGKVIGRFSKDDYSMLIDATAKRSYRMRRIMYQRANLIEADVGIEGLEPKHLGDVSAAPLHQLPEKVDFSLPLPRKRSGRSEERLMRGKLS